MHIFSYPCIWLILYLRSACGSRCKSDNMSISLSLPGYPLPAVYFSPLYGPILLKLYLCVKDMIRDGYAVIENQIPRSKVNFMVKNLSFLQSLSDLCPLLKVAPFEILVFIVQRIYKP